MHPGTGAPARALRRGAEPWSHLWGGGALYLPPWSAKLPDACMVPAAFSSDPPELAGGREEGASVQLWEALDFFALKGDFECNRPVSRSLSSGNV